MHIANWEERISKYCYTVKYGFSALCDIVSRDQKYIEQIGLLKQGFKEISLHTAIFTAISNNIKNKDINYTDIINEFSFPLYVPYNEDYSTIIDFFSLEISSPDPRVFNVPFIGTNSVVHKIAIELSRQTLFIKDLIPKYGFRGYSHDRSKTFNELLFDLNTFLFDEYVNMINLTPEMHKEDYLPISKLSDKAYMQIIDKMRNLLSNYNQNQTNTDITDKTKSRGNPKRPKMTWYIDKYIYDQWKEYCYKTECKRHTRLDFTQNYLNLNKIYHELELQERFYYDDHKTEKFYRDYQDNEKVSTKIKAILDRVRKRIEEQRELSVSEHYDYIVLKFK